MLQSTFPPWLQKLENQVKSKKGLKADQKKKLLLSDETLLGVCMTGKAFKKKHHVNLTLHIIITAYSFIELIKFIFTIPGVKSFLSERISQDPCNRKILQSATPERWCE